MRREGDETMGGWMVRLYEIILHPKCTTDSAESMLGTEGCHHNTINKPQCQFMISSVEGVDY